MRLNEVVLNQAALVNAFSSRTHVYEIDPVTFGITGPGAVRYEEQDFVENTLRGGTGVSGTTLAVLYEDASRSGRRHVVFGVHNTNNAAGAAAVNLTGLPTATDGNVALSIGMSWECSSEQKTTVTLNGSTITTVAGGRDDGTDSTVGCGAQDWNSLITGGSFGVSDDDELVGTDGDDLDAEPADGDSLNSRLSDELWRVPYDDSGDVTVTVNEPNNNGYLQFYAISIEVDSDGDGVIDANDPCPNSAPDDANDDGVCDDEQPNWQLVAVDPNPNITTDQPLITGTYDPARLDTLDVTVDGVTYTLGVDPELTVDGSGNWALDLAAGAQQLADGTYDVELVQTDATGAQTSDATTDELTVDAPPRGVLVNPNQAFATPAPTIRGTYDPTQLDTLTVVVNGTTYTLGIDSALAVTPGGDWTLTLADTAQRLDDGDYTVIVTQVDPQGNEVSDEDDVTVDTPPTGVSVVDGQTFTTTTPEVVGTFDPSQLGSLIVIIDGVTYTQGIDDAFVINGNSWAVQVPPSDALTEGTFDATVVQTDPQGNRVEDTASITIDILPDASQIGVDAGQLFRIDQPTITGSYDPAQLSGLVVTVNNVPYTLGVSPELTVDGSGSWALDLTAGANTLLDDDYTVTVTQTDDTGNAVDGAGDITVDVLPQAPTITPLVTNDTSPTLSGTYDADQLDSLIVTVNGVTYSAADAVDLDGNGIWTLDLAATGQTLTEGTYDILVTATDAQGNDADDTSVDEVEIDLTPPDAPTVTNLATADTTPVIQGTYDPSDTETLTVTIDGTTYTLGGDPELTVNTSTGRWTLNLNNSAPLADDTYTVTAEATDAVGNTSSGSGEVTIDSSLPIAPTVDQLLSNSRTPTITGTYDPAGSVDFSVTVDGTTYTESDPALTLDPANETWALNVGGPLADGTYDVAVTSTNQVGTTTTDTTVDELTIDATPPLAPTVVTQVSDDGRPILEGTYDASDLGTFSVTVDGRTYTLGTSGELVLNNGVWTLNLTGLPDALIEGVYDVVVVQVDEAGNAALDTTLDELEVAYPVPGQPTIDEIISADGLPLITGTYDPTLTDTLTVTVDGVTYSPADDALTLNPDGTWALDLTGLQTPLADGTYDVEVVATDAFGVEITDPTVDELVVDSTPPGVPSVDSLLTNNGSPTLTGTYDTTDTGAITVTIDGSTYTVDDGSLTIHPDGTWELTLPPLADGTYDVIVEHTDDAGNTTTDTTIDEVIIDTTAPGAPTVDPITNVDGLPLITGTYDTLDTGTITVTVDGTTYTVADAELTLNPDGTWQLDLTGLPSPLADGTYDVQVVHTDDAGNSTPDGTTDELTVDTDGGLIDTADTADTADIVNSYYTGGGGFGCATAPAPALWLTLLPLLGLLRRRDR